MAEQKERRSIADAMQVNSEKMAFIQGNSAGPHKQEPKAEEKVPSPIAGTHMPNSDREALHPNNSEQSQNRRERTSRHRRTFRSSSEKAAVQSSNNFGYGMNNLLVPLTTRLQPATAAALKRAGLEQKLRGQIPSTVQEIVEIAIQSWLRQNSFTG